MVFSAIFAGLGAAMSAAGFGTTGIASGSIAAGFQSTVGDVGAGSLFATLQSFGARGGFAGMIIAGLAGMILLFAFSA